MITKLRDYLMCHIDELYLLYFLPIAGCVSMGLSSDRFIYKVCFAIAIIFLLLKVWVTNYTLIEFLFMGSVMAVLGYVYLRTSEKTLIISSLSIFGCKDVNVKKVLKYTLIVYIIGMSLTICMVMLGKIQGELHILNKGGIQYTINDFGFSHPNSAYNHLLMIALMIVAVWQERLRWYHFGIMTLIMFIAYKVFFSRTGFMIYLLLCAAISLLHIIKSDKFKRVLFSILNLVPVAVLTLSYILMIWYDKGIPFVIKLNNFVTGRIILSWKAYKYAGIGLIGNANRNIIEGVFVDNAYLNVLISNGIIVCILLVAVYTFACFQYWKTGVYHIQIILSIIAIYAFMEYMVINTTWNPLLLFISEVIFLNVRRDSKE